ncbi:MAG: ATP-binding cassette domain-containing protein [Desulfopila sp.]
MRIKNYHSDTLHIDYFAPGKNEAWCIYGTNRSGIDSFIKLLAGESKGKNRKQPGETAVITFAEQQELFEEELRRDNSDFLDHLDPGTPAHAFIKHPEKCSDLIHAFDLENCMDKGYRQLSSGESRKLLLLSALSYNPETLIIENPYDGIDHQGCRELDRILAALVNHGLRILVTAGNSEDIPRWCSHLAILHDGCLAFQGTRQETLLRYEASGLADDSPQLRLQTDRKSAPLEANELIRLRNGFARYGGVKIFQGLDLTVTTGEHTLLTGPNGSGKSTLLQIISGDNQNCYANDLRMFGRKRGSGESIWELKHKMGIVSPDLHRNHYIPGSPLQVVLSGIFDSIGVYQHYTSSQKERALSWLDMLGLHDKAHQPFRRLSYAEQRLCLIGRALIKMPCLLILDEPTQGLDQGNRESLLDFLETIAEQHLSTILYASHRSDEYRSFFRQHIDLSIL